MKKLILLPLLFMNLFAVAQRNTGVITYEHTMSFEKGKFEGADLPEGIADILAKPQKSAKILYYTAEATLYEQSETKADEGTYEEGNVRIQRIGDNPDEKIYSDLKTGKRIEQRDLMGKLFLVEGESILADKWKMTGRQKIILGMPCMEAQMTETKLTENGRPLGTVTAWYTTSIPVSSGPEGMNGLPGMILELSIGDNIHIRATKLDEINEQTLKNIKPPLKGKKVTGDEFKKIAETKMAEMEQQFGGKGKVIMKVENR